MGKKQDAKRKKLEEFRSFRTSERREQRKKERSKEREDVKTQNCFVREKNPNENEATKFAIETEQKTINGVLKIK